MSDIIKAENPGSFFNYAPSKPTHHCEKHGTVWPMSISYHQEGESWHSTNFCGRCYIDYMKSVLPEIYVSEKK